MVSRRATAPGGAQRSRDGFVRCSGGGRDLDGVAEGLQLPDELVLTVAGCRGVRTLEVVRAQVLELHTVMQDVPDDDQHVVGDRDGGLPAVPPTESAVEPAEPG